MASQEEEVITVFVPPSDYAYHINQVASVSTDHFRVIRKKFSVKTPYVFEEIPIDRCTRIDYLPGLAPTRIVLGVLLTGLMLAIFYYLGVYWTQL